MKAMNIGIMTQNTGKIGIDTTDFKRNLKNNVAIDQHDQRIEAMPSVRNQGMQVTTPTLQLNDDLKHTKNFLDSHEDSFDGAGGIS